MPKVRWVMLCGFCSKFHTLSNNAESLQIDWLTFDKVTESLKVWTFLRHSVVLVLISIITLVCGWVSAFRKPCEHHISKRNRKGFHQILVTDVFGFTDVLVRFLVQMVKVQDHSRRRHMHQWQPVEFHLVFLNSKTEMYVSWQVMH